MATNLKQSRATMLTRSGKQLAALAAVITISACGPAAALGGLGEVLGTVLGQPAGAGQHQVAVEIRGVHPQQQIIQVTTQDGQTGNVRYDQNTVVWHRQQQYPVTALEPGDLAVMLVQDVQGTPYAARVEVQQSARERTGTGAVVQLSGRVTQVDHNAGTFVMQTTGGPVQVTLPYGAPQATVNYFHTLRVGHDVRVEAAMIATGRAEIHRFL
jgi:hypothetical protein